MPCAQRRQRSEMVSIGLAVNRPPSNCKNFYRQRQKDKIFTANRQGSQSLLTFKRLRYALLRTKIGLRLCFFFNDRFK